MTIKAIFFDLDGTLVDSNELHVDAWDEVFRAHGRVIDRDAIHAQIGKGGDNLVPALWPGAGEKLAEEMSTEHGRVFKPRLAEVRPFPCASALLRHARDAGKTIVLASSAGEEEVKHYIDLLHGQGVVAQFTSKDEVDRSKPDPGIFARALEKVAPIRTEEVIVVGDSPYDVEAAAKCGIRAIGLRSGGFPDAALLEAGAIAIYQDVAELLGDFDRTPLAG